MAWALWANSVLLTDMRSGTTSQRWPWALSGGMPLISVTHAPCWALQILRFVLSRLMWKRVLRPFGSATPFRVPTPLNHPLNNKVNFRTKIGQKKGETSPWHPSLFYKSRETKSRGGHEDSTVYMFRQSILSSCVGSLLLSFLPPFHSCSHHFGFFYFLTFFSFSLKKFFF